MIRRGVSPHAADLVTAVSWGLGALVVAWWRRWTPGWSWGRAGIVSSALFYAPAVVLAFGLVPNVTPLVYVTWLGLFGFGVPFVALASGMALWLRHAFRRTIGVV